jgi:hypothetical protein
MTPFCLSGVDKVDFEVSELEDSFTGFFPFLSVGEFKEEDLISM